MKKIIFLVLSLAVILSAAIIPAFAANHLDVDPSQNFIMPRETNVNTDTDSSIMDSLDSMMPDSMGTNVPDSAVDSNSAPESTSALENMGDEDGTSALIGVIVSIIAVVAVIVIVIALMTKNKDKK